MGSGYTPAPANSTLNQQVCFDYPGELGEVLTTGGQVNIFDVQGFTATLSKLFYYETGSVGFSSQAP